MNIVNTAVTIVSLCVTAVVSNAIYDINTALSAKVDAVRPAYSHTASLYESEAEECAALGVTYCSPEMLVVLRAQR